MNIEKIQQTSSQIQLHLNKNFNYFSGRAGRSVSFATESQRKIIREIVRQSRNPVKSRVVPPAVITKFIAKIQRMGDDVKRILEEEAAEKEIAKLENRYFEISALNRPNKRRVERYHIVILEIQ
jgi:superfamily II DNA/RNA helicase